MCCRNLFGDGRHIKSHIRNIFALHQTLYYYIDIRNGHCCKSIHLLRTTKGLNYHSYQFTLGIDQKAASFFTRNNICRKHIIILIKGHNLIAIRRNIPCQNRIIRTKRASQCYNYRSVGYRIRIPELSYRNLFCSFFANLSLLDSKYSYTRITIIL